MAPGILAQGVLFIAIFYGIAVIWERDLGVVPDGARRVSSIGATSRSRRSVVITQPTEAGALGAS